MTVIDLRELVRSPLAIPSQRRGVHEASGSAESDLCRSQGSRNALWRVMATDIAAGLLGAELAKVVLPDLSIAGEALLLLSWTLALVSTGEYGSRLVQRTGRRLSSVVSAAVRLCAVLAILAVLVPALPLPVLVPTVLTIATATLAARWGVERWVAARREAVVPSILVRGPSEHLQRLVRTLDASGDSPFKVAAVQVTDGVPVAEEVAGGRTLVPGSHDLVEAAERNDVNAVLFVGPQFDDPGDLRRSVWRLEARNIGTHLVPVVADLSAPSVATLEGSGIPILSFHTRDLGAEVGFTKVIVDKVLALGGLVVLMPLIALASLMVKITSPGPILFRQTRVGLGGEHFEMLKFRTMYRDAEARKAELAELNVHEGGTLFKITDDPRVTRVGRFLRKYSIDELPQLVNVLRGEMSLVGPRPSLPEEVAKYPVDAHRRFCVRPGLTGLWQVSGRSDLDPEESVRLDTHYVEQWSAGLDVKILAKTPGVVISGRGAY